MNERLSREELRKVELSRAYTRLSRVYFSGYPANGDLARRIVERREPQVSIRASLLSRATLA